MLVALHCRGPLMQPVLHQGKSSAKARSCAGSRQPSSIVICSTRSKPSSTHLLGARHRREPGMGIIGAHDLSYGRRSATLRPMRQRLCERISRNSYRPCAGTARRTSRQTNRRHRHCCSRAGLVGAPAGAEATTVRRRSPARGGAHRPRQYAPRPSGRSDAVGRRAARNAHADRPVKELAAIFAASAEKIAVEQVDIDLPDSVDSLATRLGDRRFDLVFINRPSDGAASPPQGALRDFPRRNADPSENTTRFTEADQGSYCGVNPHLLAVFTIRRTFPRYAVRKRRDNARAAPAALGCACGGCQPRRAIRLQAPVIGSFDYQGAELAW